MADRIPEVTPELAQRPAFTREGLQPVLAPVELPDSELPRPQLDYDVRRGVWYLSEAYRIRLRGHQVRIPAGFTLDLASVPRVLWWMISSFELGMVGPLLHDGAYQHAGDFPAGWVEPPRTCTRAEADRLFLWAMEEEGVPLLKRQAAYRAVRWFGRSAWRKR